MCVRWYTFNLNIEIHFADVGNLAAVIPFLLLSHVEHLKFKISIKKKTTFIINLIFQSLKAKQIEAFYYIHFCIF